MENNKKPIDNIKEDISSIVKSINKLQEDFHELRKLNNEIKDKIKEYLEHDVPEKPKSNSWFY
tara:strand:+ start:277 stop:465 length:189 start_codon:yes stop_codon:yes gene_type:complete